jgi:Fur family peroxide stress response transcriptional regulator
VSAGTEARTEGWASKAAEALRRAGYKLTPQRLKLLEILERRFKEHPSFKELYEEARKEMPTMSTSTLYSLLLTLEGLGLVRLFSWEGETRVEVDARPHINVLQPHSPEIIDIDDPEAVRAVEEALKRKGVKGRLAMVNVVVYPE